MKFIKILLGFILTVVIVIYTLLFTGFGNSILRPVIEAKVALALGLPAKLKSFHLSFSNLDILLYLTDQNSIHIYGKYSPLSQSFDLNYDVKLLSLPQLKLLTKKELRGDFKTDGTIKGDLDLITVDGKSDIAKSDTAYHVELTKFDPTLIKAQIKALQVDALLAMLTQPSFVHANLDLNLDFKNIKPHQLDGTIALATHQGFFDKAVIQKELNVTIPTTHFSMKADAKLDKERIVYNYLFDSNLLKLTTNGQLIPEPLQTDIVYKASIKELALLQPLTHANLQGRINLNGTLKGDKEKMLLKLFSDVASSKTSLLLTLKELQPSTLQAKISHLKLQKLLYMLKQPHYTDGTLNLQADIKSLKMDALKGKVITSTTGDLNTPYLTKAYKFKHPMPKTHFKLKTSSTLSGTKIDTLATLHSNLAKLYVKKARFDIKDSSLESDYTIKVPSLDQLYFVSDRHLRGGIEANGEIRKSKTLTLTLFSEIANGKLRAKLIDQKLHLNLYDVKTKKVLWILKYPEIFDARMNAKVDYDIKSQKGIATANFKDGQFVQNQLFDMVKKFGKVNLYREYFNGDAKADINKEKILAQYDLLSRKAQIHSKKTLLNTKSSTIDAKIDLKVEKTPVSVTLKGDIAKPKVGIDLKAFMRSEAGKKLQKKATKELNKLFKKLF
ncbi:hypothetical protein MNB_SM-7-1373 [hydrothermal vent metagenome]|uniref:AsmA-like C-terminal domain-containing protein n=1 Tax=hydrothermal vent metagenome TaxID=652676 RepID=A0A1W1BYP4_9ZZZZ